MVTIALCQSSGLNVPDCPPLVSPRGAHPFVALQIVAIQGNRFDLGSKVSVVVGVIGDWPEHSSARHSGP